MHPAVPPRALAAALLAAALTACAGNADKEAPLRADTGTSVAGQANAPVSTPQANPVVPGADRPNATAAVSDPVTLAEVDTVIVTASRGLTAIPVTIAVPLIQRLEDRLDATNVEPLDQIASELEELREELGKTPVDGRRVGTILLDLGNRTSAVGGNAQIAGAAAPKLTQLGELLVGAGRQLGGTIAGRPAAPK
ncbi:MAG: hypothetical protein AVDCRST_MAG11-1937 [uncultured Gemmatimonadaceae bacterium]|uniref:Uncharacterized protein n=1 Tax=uncultured Gemmatimonadaceae bacterium TaxID=246130 RepID=A0A6J4L0S8_9BACT|nr:MAG: hypothetical protein AVDCRST_MAG11-1937 [uncultured Gemmatimonadaceae bacterium]